MRGNADMICSRCGAQAIGEVMKRANAELRCAEPKAERPRGRRS